MKIGLAQVFQVFFVIVVEFDDLFDERLVAGKIRAVEKTARVELRVDFRIAPVNRQAARDHGLKNFFGGVTQQRTVFKGDVELVRTQEINLRLRAGRNG